MAEILLSPIKATNDSILPMQGYAPTKPSTQCNHKFSTRWQERLFWQQMGASWWLSCPEIQQSPLKVVRVVLGVAGQDLTPGLAFDQIDKKPWIQVSTTNVPLPRELKVIRWRVSVKGRGTEEAAARTGCGWVV